MRFLSLSDHMKEDGAGHGLGWMPSEKSLGSAGGGSSSSRARGLPVRVCCKPAPWSAVLSSGWDIKVQTTYKSALFCAESMKLLKFMVKNRTLKYFPVKGIHTFRSALHVAGQSPPSALSKFSVSSGKFETTFAELSTLAELRFSKEGGEMIIF